MSKIKVAHYSFPADLAARVSEGWSQLVGGDYSPPPLPDPARLRELLETAYLAGMETDELRPLRFMLCCTVDAHQVSRQGDAKPVESWEMVARRPFNIQEIRRLAVVTDLDSSGIWVQFSQDPSEELYIRGLVNLGRSWSIARSAFAYHYDPLPHALLIRVIAPGHMVIYQGNYRMAALAKGTLEVREVKIPSFDLLGADMLFQEGHRVLRQMIVTPSHESPREWCEFEWMAYMNCILAILNGMQLAGHGGALILKSIRCNAIRTGLLRMKYGLAEGRDRLQRGFVEFMNLRHRYGDMLWVSNGQKQDATAQTQLELASFQLREIQDRLAQTCSFVGAFALTDGAVILNTDLIVEGFGAEIVLDKVKQAEAFEVVNPLDQEDRRRLDSEQMGMRHRSAIRLCATEANLAVFVASQDGGVSLVWNRGGDVCFKSGITTTNMNMVLA